MFVGQGTFPDGPPVFLETYMSEGAVEVGRKAVVVSGGSATLTAQTVNVVIVTGGTLRVAPGTQVKHIEMHQGGKLDLGETD